MTSIQIAERQTHIKDLLQRINSALSDYPGFIGEYEDSFLCPVLIGQVCDEWDTRNWNNLVAICDKESHQIQTLLNKSGFNDSFRLIDFTGRLQIWALAWDADLLKIVEIVKRHDP